MNRRALITIFLVAAISAPVTVYLWIFGEKISSDHTRWAEFGSAIGGIYSPIVALLALIVLLRQVELQAQMNVHEFDQAYLQQARQDIEFYSTQMAQVLDAIALPGRSLRAVLHENFAPSYAAQLDEQELRQFAANIYGVLPSTFDIWLAIYPIFTGLAVGKASVYGMTYGSSRQKLIALLSLESCAALDNFHRVMTKGTLQVKYIFSPLLSER
jgi:hypothetical protein